VSPSEIGFLALGLCIGGAAGAALLVAVRAHRIRNPAVRVTITPNAIPPRSARSAAGAAVSTRRTPMRGSPEDDAWRDAVQVAAVPASTPVPPMPGGRTRVPSLPVEMPAGAVAIPIVGGAGARSAAPSPGGPGRPAVAPSSASSPAAPATVRLTPAAVPTVPVVPSPAAPVPPPRSQATLAPTRAAVAVAVAEVDAPTLPAPPVRDPLAFARLDVGERSLGGAVRTRPPVPDPRPVIGTGAVGIPILAAGSRSRSSGAAARPASAKAAADPCVDGRVAAAARCAAADAARDAARLAADAVRDAQRTHASLQARIEEAGATGDPRRVAAEKERLHAEFTAAHERAPGAEEAEAAAKAWLTAVSELNTRARDAVQRIQAATEELRTRAAALDRLEASAESARIIADRAEAECRAAREDLAQCEERQQAALPVPQVGARPFEEHWPDASDSPFDHPAAPADRNRPPAVIRILRGDAAAHERVVATLAGDDPAARSAWHVRLVRLTDAITARAIEDGYLDLPQDDPFWGLFSGDEQREVVGALSSLGFRYDGMQGFADDRVPSARDLALAVGYAGLDRMRIRAWPGPAALAGLYAGASVTADVWLAGQSDDLALGRVVDALGARAADLSEVWDAWGRVRPALLSDS
jgi:hypothetical protein